jgi:hypothetical protein
MVVWSHRVLPLLEDETGRGPILASLRATQASVSKPRNRQFLKKTVPDAQHALIEKPSKSPSTCEQFATRMSGHNSLN